MYACMYVRICILRQAGLNSSGGSHVYSLSLSISSFLSRSFTLSMFSCLSLSLSYSLSFPSSSPLSVSLSFPFFLRISFTPLQFFLPLSLLYLSLAGSAFVSLAQSIYLSTHVWVYRFLFVSIFLISLNLSFTISNPRLHSTLNFLYRLAEEFKSISTYLKECKGDYHCHRLVKIWEITRGPDNSNRNFKIGSSRLGIVVFNDSQNQFKLEDATRQKQRWIVTIRNLLFAWFFLYLLLWARCRSRRICPFSTRTSSWPCH